MWRFWISTRKSLWCARAPWCHGCIGEVYRLVYWHLGLQFLDNGEVLEQRRQPSDSSMVREPCSKSGTCPLIEDLQVKCPRGYEFSLGRCRGRNYGSPCLFSVRWFFMVVMTLVLTVLVSVLSLLKAVVFHYVWLVYSLLLFISMCEFLRHLP